MVELQTQFSLPKFFGATLLVTPPKLGPKKSIFLTTPARAPAVLNISRYLTDKYFDIVWGYYTPPPPPGDLPNGSPKINFLNGLT